MYSFQSESTNHRRKKTLKHLLKRGSKSQEIFPAHALNSELLREWEADAKFLEGWESSFDFGSM